MKEIDRPVPLEEALHQCSVFGNVKYFAPSNIMEEVDGGVFQALHRAARRYAEIEKAVKAGRLALVPTEPTAEMKSAATKATDSGVGRPIPIYKYMLRAHGTDPLISGGG